MNDIITTTMSIGHVIAIIYGIMVACIVVWYIGLILWHVITSLYVSLGIQRYCSDIHSVFAITCEIYGIIFHGRRYNKNEDIEGSRRSVFMKFFYNSSISSNGQYPGHI